MDLAIHGKLVVQDRSDEPAIELLKRIAPNAVACDNSHYEKLPQNWCVCKLKDVFDITMGSSPSGNTISNNENGIEFHIGDNVSVVDSELHEITYGEENICDLEIKNGDTIVILDLNNIDVIVGAKYYIYTSVTEHIKSIDCHSIPGDYNGESKIDILSFPLRADSQYRYMKKARFVQFMDNVSNWFIYIPGTPILDGFEDGETITLVEADGNACALAVGIFEVVTSKRLKITVGGGSDYYTTLVASIDKPLDEGDRYKVIIQEEEPYLEDIDPTIEQPEDSDIVVVDNYTIGSDIYCNEDTDKWLFLYELDSEDNMKYWAKEKTFFRISPDSRYGYNTLSMTCVEGSTSGYCKLITDDAPEGMYYMYAFSDQVPLLYNFNYLFNNKLIIIISFLNLTI